MIVELSAGLPKPTLRSDIPSDYWLQQKRDEATEEGFDSFGAPKFFGPCTGSWSRLVLLPVAVLKKLKGLRGEQDRVRVDDLNWLVEHMGTHKRLPLLKQGVHEAPFINVWQDGTAWVNEGNHRILAAAKLGFKFLPVEVKYYLGGERLANGVLAPSKILLFDTVARQEGYTLTDYAPRPLKEAASNSIRWSGLQPQTWYKAIVRNNVGGFRIDDKVWLKINDELPWRGGLSYWLYDPLRDHIVHISDRVIHEFVKLYLGNALATPVEQQTLNKYWLPLVRKKVEFQRKLIKKYNKQHETSSFGLTNDPFTGVRGVYVWRDLLPSKGIQRALDVVSNVTGTKLKSPGLHVTIMYSKACLSQPSSYTPLTDRVEATISGITTWVGHDGQLYAVLTLDSQPLHERHSQLKNYGAQPTFEPYNPHLTLVEGADLSVFDEETTDEINKQLAELKLKVFLAKEQVADLKNWEKK